MKKYLLAIFAIFCLCIAVTADAPSIGATPEQTATIVQRTANAAATKTARVVDTQTSTAATSTANAHLTQTSVALTTVPPATKTAQAGATNTSVALTVTAAVQTASAVAATMTTVADKTSTAKAALTANAIATQTANAAATQTSVDQTVTAAVQTASAVAATMTTVANTTGTARAVATSVAQTATASAPTPTNTPAPCVFVVPVGNSIQTALNSATSGCTIQLRNGTHTITTPLQSMSDGVTMTSYPGEFATINGNATAAQIITVDHSMSFVNMAMTNAGGTYGDLVILNGDNTTFTDFVGYGVNQAIINMSATADGMTVTGCDMSHAATGIQIRGTNVVIDDCYFHDMDRVVNDDPLNCTGSHGGQAVSVLDSVGPVLVENSVGYLLTAPSQCYVDDGSFVEIVRGSNVTVTNNSASFGVTFMESAGIVTNNIISYNTVDSQVFLTLHDSGGFTIQHNTVTNLAQNIFFGGTSSVTDFSFNTISNGADRMFWLTTHAPTCSFHDNTYTWTYTGSRPFGHEGTSNWTTKALWLANVEC